MGVDVQGYLAARRAEGEPLQEKWTQLEDLYNRKCVFDRSSPALDID